MTDTTTPTTNVPSAPAPSAAPAPAAPSAAPAPDFSGAPGNEMDGGMTETAIAEFGNTDASSFLESFLADEGFGPLDASAAPAPNVAPSPAPGNAAPAAPNALPTNAAPAPAPAVDQSQLDRLLGRQPAPQVPPVAAQPAPQPMPQAAPVQPAPQPQPPAAQPQAPEQWTPFTEALQLPPELANALGADDPNVRNAAIGSMLAGFGNSVARQIMSRLTSVEFPQLAQATVGHVQQTTQAQAVQDTLYGAYPALRHVNPNLIHQAAVIVTEAEAARGTTTVTPEIVKKIGALAMQAAQQSFGAGPFASPAPSPMGFAPQPQSFQPQAPQMPVAPAGVQPMQGTDGNWYVQTPGGWVAVAPPVPPQPAPPPFVAGQSAGGFGAPPVHVPTPESEFQSFMQGGW